MQLRPLRAGLAYLAVTEIPLPFFNLETFVAFQGLVGKINLRIHLDVACRTVGEIRLGENPFIPRDFRIAKCTSKAQRRCVDFQPLEHLGIRIEHTGLNGCLQGMANGNGRPARMILGIGQFQPEARLGAESKFDQPFIEFQIKPRLNPCAKFDVAIEFDLRSSKLFRDCRVIDRDKATILPEEDIKPTLYGTCKLLGHLNRCLSRDLKSNEQIDVKRLRCPDWNITSHRDLVFSEFKEILCPLGIDTHLRTIMRLPLNP